MRDDFLLFDGEDIRGVGVMPAHDVMLRSRHGERDQAQIDVSEVTPTTGRRWADTRDVAG